MGNKAFEVKISDMLQSKITDHLSFENKSLESLKNLTDDGVSGEITLQSIWKDSIFATIDQCSCSLKEECERCGEAYERDVEIEDYMGKYVLESNASEDKEEEILLIDAKNGVIDLSELVYHAVQLQEPFVKYCPNCQKEHDALPEEDFDQEES